MILKRVVLLTVFLIPIMFCYKIPETKFGNPISKAIASIIVDFYSNYTTIVHVVKVFRSPNSQILQNGILNEIIYDTKNEVLFQIEDLDFLTTPTTDSYIIFIDSIDLFKIALAKLKLLEFDRTGFFIVAFTEELSDRYPKLVEVFELCWAEWIVDVDVMVLDSRDDSKAVLYTYFPFSERGCGLIFPVEYDYFLNGKAIQGKHAFPPKCANLFNCPVYVGTFQLEPYMFLKERFNKTYYDGIEGIVLRVLSQRLKFDPILVEPEDDRRWGNYINGTYTGILKELKEKRVNLTIGSMGTNTYSLIEGVTTTVSYLEFKVVFVVPPGKPFSNVEKLFLPFKYIIWSCIISCYICTVILLLILKCFPKYMYNFVFGPKNNIPLITMVSVWFGNSLDVLPKRNFARYVLMVWILAALVLRSTYQGVLFDIIRSKKTSSPLDTLNKIYKAKYEIFVSERMAEMVSKMDKRVIPKLRIVGPYELDEMAKNTLNNTFKGVAAIGEPMISWENKKNLEKNQIYYQSKDIIFNLQGVIYTNDYSCLLAPINQELWKYMSAGLVHAWSLIFLSDPFTKEKKDEAAEPLTMKSLSGIFQVYCALIILCFLIFLTEIVYHKYVNLRKIKVKKNDHYNQKYQKTKRNRKYPPISYN